MSSWLVVFTGLIYLYIACEQAWKGGTATAIMFFGYAFANIGIWMQTK